MAARGAAVDPGQAKANADKMEKWRLGVSMDQVKAFRKTFDDAGVKIEIVKVDGIFKMSDGVLDYVFNMAKALGARALYLTTNGIDYGYRIHGTPEWFSIGKNASSGCIRMINQDVMDLFDRVPNGTKVIVLNADGSFPKGLNLPPKPPAKKKAAPAPAPIVVPQPAVMPVPVVTGAAPAVTPAPAAATPVLAPTKPAVLPTTAPAAAEPPACKVPLVAGACPPEVKTTP